MRSKVCLICIGMLLGGGLGYGLPYLKKETAPVADESEMQRLDGLLDKAHWRGAHLESGRFNDVHRYRLFREVAHRRDDNGMMRATPFYYHRNCRVCDENMKIRKEMDVLLARHADQAKAWRWEEFTMFTENGK